MMPTPYDNRNIPLDKKFQRRAIYFQESDCVEYVRADEANLYRRIDSFLTLIVRMQDREVIGFKLKGFRNFYIRHLHGEESKAQTDFLILAKVIEEAVTEIGDTLFEEELRNEAYQTAAEIAKEDQVTLTELPEVA